MEESASEGVLGFAIERTEHSSGQTRWLRGFKSFSTEGLARGTLVPTNEHPLQTFLWGDFTARNNTKYTYRVVAMRGTPRELSEGESVSVEVETENEQGDTHGIYFNRGVAGSQAYSRRFGNRRPSEVPDREAWRWLSRGLFKAMLDFIAQANGPTYSLRAAVYEFNQGAVLQAFARAKTAGADVSIVYDARTVIHPTDPERSKLQPAESNRTAIEAAGLDDVAIRRTADPRAISHNKFIVLLENGVPKEVLTGSTNITDGGIFGHSNVVHIVRDPKVAAQYLQYWEKLAEDPRMDRRDENDQIRPFNEENSPLPTDASSNPGMAPVFSPRKSLEALEWYSGLMESAQSAVFLTAAFGVNDLFEAVMEQPKDYLRYLMLESEDEDMATLNRNPNNRVVVGNLFSGNNALENWLREQRLLSERLSGLNRHVKYIHTKYMLIDPLGNNPIVITGSANFSDASTRRNDENMLIIRDNPRVADVYLGEFMRLFKHFQFRAAASTWQEGTEDEEAANLLIPDDSWRLPFYNPARSQCKERKYFSRAT
ncbi:MAG: hypothetical protein EOP84_05850 [Verrucomicrobiaceae bacterium]|nr:MAG: hypothetical protein EOP84_05850 [Verrucomicrobiaceae bacterium]